MIWISISIHVGGCAKIQYNLIFLNVFHSVVLEDTFWSPNFKKQKQNRPDSRNMLCLGKYCKMIIQSILEIHGAHFGD